MKIHYQKMSVNVIVMFSGLTPDGLGDFVGSQSCLGSCAFNMLVPFTT